MTLTCTDTNTENQYTETEYIHSKKVDLAALG